MQARAADDELRLGAGLPQTRILCASYHQDPATTVPLLALLPDVLHVPSRQADAALDTTLRLLAHEISRPQPGAAAILNRIVDILLVQLLRAWLDRPRLDRHVPGRCHRGLPRHAGPPLSRAGRRDPGCLPDSLAQDLAARRLRDTDDTVSTIARSLGYASEYAFNHAFTRARRISPGRYRTKSRL
ncbi:MAG TPA: cupin domain-containing protein [Streptosporangiaceae bacterium]